MSAKIATPDFEIPPVILVDTREKKPYKFKNRSDSRVFDFGLKSGDYSLYGYHRSGVAVERKSLADLVGSLTTNRARFHRECRRLMEFDSACVVVEAAWSDVVEGLYPNSVHPSSIIGSIIAIEIDSGIPFYFLSNRKMAEEFTFRYLMRFYKKMQRLGIEPEED